MTDNNKFETPDLDIAAYLKEVKGLPVVGHRFNGKQLLILFEITTEDFEVARQEYWNSIQARCDASRKNFLQILKDRRP